MQLVIDPARTVVTIETEARGMLARLAHDLRIEAREARGESVGDSQVRATFPVSAMRVVESRRHGSDGWGGPPESDQTTIEQKIRDEVFTGVREVRVNARLDGERATVTVEARGRQTVNLPVTVERTDGIARVRGEATLSLSTLRTGEPKVPFGAIKLEDIVVVRFDVVLVEKP